MSSCCHERQSDANKEPLDGVIPYALFLSLDFGKPVVIVDETIGFLKTLLYYGEITWNIDFTLSFISY